MHQAPPDPKQLLIESGLWAKKSFGQNFLRDFNVHQKVATAIAARPEDHVIELGSGLGTLTWYLAQSGAKIFGVERDRELAPVLRRVFAEQKNVEILEADAKAVSYADFAPVPPAALHVAGNIPYNLTGPILFSLFEQRASIKRVALLVQKEVAERIVAGPGSKTYGLMSVVLGSVAKPRRVCVVGRGAFHPAPRVDSAVIAWEFNRELAAPQDVFLRVVKSAFQKRRKTLRNALDDFEKLADASAGLKIDLTRRPETLSPEEFVALARALSA